MNNNTIAEAGLVYMLNDLQNPITTIRLCLDLLENGDNEFRDQYYAIIKRNTEHLEMTLREIAASFIDSSGFSVHMKDSATPALAPAN